MRAQLAATPARQDQFITKSTTKLLARQPLVFILYPTNSRFIHHQSRFIISSSLGSAGFHQSPSPPSGRLSGILTD
jgi:hypothetical protein